MRKYLFIFSFITILFYSCKEQPTQPGSTVPYTFNGNIDSLVANMTIEEKIGQMMQVDRGQLSSLSDIKDYFIGSLLSGGGSSPANNSPSGWADMYDSYQSYALQTRLKIPLIYGIDAVHGHNNVRGAVIFPHNIGMGCTNDPALIKEAARITALEVAGTGIDWTFAPCIAVARDERWGRTYESFGETPELQVMAAEAAVKGFQGDNSGENIFILACAKHFLADGGTSGGNDQGDAAITESELRSIHLPGYIKAVEAGVGSVMASFSSWNGVKMHANKYLLTVVLKQSLGFQGFVVSDWAGVDQISSNYKTAVETAINAGIDMVMLPGKYREFQRVLKELINENRISAERINDAVKRILKIKVKLGLFDHPNTDRSLTSGVGSQEHRQAARECVRKSLVLLKNDNNVLPLSKNIKHLHVSGRNADNLGNQCGGWTISWQGLSGNITTGTTILQAIKKSVSPSTEVTYSPDGSNAGDADAAIVVAGETPYAEYYGDNNDLTLSSTDLSAVIKLKNLGIPVIVILVSGRPMIINTALEFSDAFAAAWLPGTEAEGITDILFGDYKPAGKLSHSWPRNMQQIPINSGDAVYDPLFPYGYGLTYP